MKGLIAVVLCFLMPIAVFASDGDYKVTYEDQFRT